MRSAGVPRVCGVAVAAMGGSGCRGHGRVGGGGPLRPGAGGGPGAGQVGWAVPARSPMTAAASRWARGTLYALSRSGSAASSSAARARATLGDVVGGGGGAQEGGFGAAGAPRAVREPAERQPQVAYGPVGVQVEDGGGGDQGEGVRGAVAGLAVRGGQPGGRGGQRDGGDQLAGLDDGVQFGVVAGQPVEIGGGHRPFTVRAVEFHVRVEGGEGDGEVGGVGGDAQVRVAEHGVVAVDAVAGAAAAAGGALVARLGEVLEVGAAGALEEVAPGGGGVAELAGGAGEQGAGHGGVAGADEGVRGEVAVADGGADAQGPVGQFLDRVEGQAGDVDEGLGGLDAELHQVHEVGAAREVAGAGVRGVGGGRLLDGAGADVREGLHRITSSTAWTMFG
ncbi:hypothetical protein J116_004035 [Streptomyces thermolilacinus SPC6]|uniref:Uncharacterized protein n=1 Tax=Streptomyces thermolilacinus SPC6 TaxID=1306406 RepID=A0A1D3DN55_9ACTN|nr:hypothetical protein J116_004035 [Streptomyces thermolilacinus SPC6]